jgi:branched-subunit amino acid aminotransferase/4-amino-4-deoxychorismate lyase
MAAEGVLLVDGARAGGDAAAPMEALAAEHGGLEVFTTARVADGEILQRPRHRARLLADGADPRVVDLALGEAAGLATGVSDAMVRVAIGARRLVALGPARRSRWAAGDAPLRLAVKADRRREPLRKETARAQLDAAEAEARAQGADAALLAGPEGLREGTWFHIVARAGGAWVTPAIAIAGTTRELFAEAAVSLGEPVERRPLSVDELVGAHAVLALSALLGLGVVGAVDGRALPLPDAAMWRAWAERIGRVGLASSAVPLAEPGSVP